MKRLLLIHLLILPLTYLEAQVPLLQSDFFFEVNFGEITNQLNNSPLLLTDVNSKTQFKSSSAIIELPLPTGEMLSFKALEDQVLSKDLSKKFPSIKSYQIADSTVGAYGRITINENHFRAFLKTGNGDVIIYPFENGYKSSYEIRPNIFDGCDTHEILPDKLKIKSSSSISGFSVGSDIKTYRLAILTTGEYYNQFGPTSSDVMTAVASDVAALNAVFINEVGIKFTLALSHFFDDTATDPFNPGLSNKASQAKDAFDSLATNDPSNFAFTLYDIGHVLHYSPGGGGQAYLASACYTDGTKGGGWSGVSSTYKSTFYHEVGHQFYAGHTFNSDSGGCNGNLMSSWAVEPGSGSTIMSYLGSCSPENLSGSPFSRTYFNANSIEYMLYMVGNFATCYTSTSSGNTPPVVTANPSGNPVVIPKGTPFTLKGMGSDADLETVLFNWEQMDAGTVRGGADDAVNSTDSPVFRSFEPSPNGNIRTFPMMSTILDGSSPNVEEALPQVARTINMRLTGKDGNTVSGGVTSDDLPVIIDNSGPFEITSHNTSTSLAAGSTFVVTWAVNGTQALSSNVKILMSVNRYDYPFELLSSTPNNGSASITIPSNFPATTTGRIKISSIGGDGHEWFDVNNADLTITSSCLTSSNLICPTDPLITSQGNGSLNLGLDKFSGSKLTFPLTNSFPGSSSQGMYVYTDQNRTACHLAWSTNAIVLKIRVETSGTYNITTNTIRPSGSSSTVSSIYNSSNFSCTSFLGSNASGAVSWYGSYSLNLNACTDYWIVFYRVFGDETALNATINGPGDVYNVNSIPAGFSHTYIAFDNSTGNASAISSTSNFINLAVGNYTIKGLLYENAFNPATYNNTTELNFYQSGSCMLFSSNTKPVTVTASPCPSSTSLVSSANDISSGTFSYQTSNSTAPGLIQATNIITGGNVTYDAGMKVEMNPGFSVQNAVFEAKIGGCN